MTRHTRYSRQVQVAKIGEAGQTRLSNSDVLIVGAGGLGCQVAAQLAGAGVGKISVVDHDLVAVSNLHRQILYREADIDQPKANIACRELARINSSIDIECHSVKITSDNAGALIDGKSAVIDAADNFPTSYLLSDQCMESGIPLVSASVNKTFGYVGVFCGTQQRPAPSVRAVFPRLSTSQTSCDTVGVTGPSVGIIANVQAQEAMKVLIGDAEQLLGKLLYLDLWNYQQHKVDFSTAKEPLHHVVQFIPYSSINDDDTLLDVRSLSETQHSPFDARNIVHIPLADLERGVQGFSKQQKIACICQTGQRAALAAQGLIDLGFERVSVVIDHHQ